MGALPDARCPICHKAAAPRPENRAFPFCSPQCKLVDLGRWLDGSYRVPGPPATSTLDMDALDPTTGRAGEPGAPPDEEDE